MQYGVHAILEAPQQAAESCECRRGWRKIIRPLLWDAGIILVGLVILEIVLQIWAPEYRRNLYDRLYTGSQPLDFNSDGYRGPLVPVEKPTGELRVLGLGDSTTFGTGVGAFDTWPLQLGELLQDGSKRPVSAINRGEPGWSLRSIRLSYDANWHKYNADVVTLLASGNMVSWAWINRNAQPVIQTGEFSNRRVSKFQQFQETLDYEVHKLCLPGFFSLNSQRAMYWIGLQDHELPDPALPLGAMLAHGWRQADLDPRVADDAWDLFSRELILLRDDVAARGAVLVVAFGPSRFDLSDSILDNEKDVPRWRLTIDPSARFELICRQNGIACVDALMALRNEREEIAGTQHRFASLYVPFDYTHFDHDGHAAIAAAMAREIDELRHRSANSN
jgi:lysophospholipase L1-like esterase